MAKSVSLMEVKYKVNFLNIFMNEAFKFDFYESRFSDRDYSLFKRDESGTSVCVLVGELKDCNNYLNKFIRKHRLKRGWNDYKNNI